MFWISVLVLYRLIIPTPCSDVITRDFQLFSKKICKTGCSKVACYPNTVISIDSIERLQSSDESECSANEFTNSAQEYNCHFKFIENHIFKTCANIYSCNICPDKIELKILKPNSFCTSEYDFKIKYRCIPGFIKNDNVCAHSYLDLSCFDRIDDKLVILNVTILSRIKATSDDSKGCSQGNSALSNGQEECQQLDKTDDAISKCSFKEKCSVGPNGFKPSHCGDMHMRISHACVPAQALYFYNKKINEPEQQVISLQSSEIIDESSSWFGRQKWKVLGILSSVMIASVISMLILCFFIRRRREKHNCAINTPKDNLFSKLGQAKFSPPPSSIDKVTIEFETMRPLEMYNCNSEIEDEHIRSIYSSSLPCTIYNAPFCVAPPTINTCQYFTPLTSPGHINLLEMPPIQLASSGNLTSSTTNSSHGTPRGTKSSGIFSMNDASFEMSHQV